MNLSPDDIKQLWEDEHYTPKGYLHHLLLAHCPPGEPWKIENVTEFCQRWNLPERQFYKAKAALIAADLIDEARRRGLVLASQRQGETTLVCLVDERWVPFEQLRSQSWDDLEAQLQPTMVGAEAEATELTTEQQQILAAMSRLTGG